MLHTLKQVPRRLLIGLVRVYQMVIGPHLPASCRYTPSCSTYAIQALQQYGAVKGTILAVWRVLRCNPWGGHGYDPPRWFTEPPQGGREDGRVGVWEESRKERGDVSG
jgi:hypothetical protein